MKASDVVKELRFRLPFYTDAFTDNIAVDEITSSGLTANVKTTVPHTLQTNDYAHISGCLIPNSVISLTQVDGIAYGEVSSTHDLTFGYHTAVQIIGANESQYNGIHKLLSVPDRKTFTFEIDSGAPATATGTILLLEDLKRFTYNGWRKITKVDDNNFTFELEKEIGSPAYGDIKMKIKPRITGALDLERARQSYTKQPPGKLWAYVVVENIAANKDRSEATDAIFTSTTMTSYRQLIIQAFHVYIFIPVTHKTSAAFARDDADDILVPLNRSLLRIKFSQPAFEEIISGAVFAGSNFGLDENSTYIHDFIYETTYNLTYQDTVDDDISVAFRDIYMDFESSLSDDGLVKMQQIINLDDDVA